MYIYITHIHTSVSTSLSFVFLNIGLFRKWHFWFEAKRAHTFRVDPSERSRRRFHYCLPEIECGYYGGRGWVVQIEFCKENDVRIESMMMDLSPMVKWKSKSNKSLNRTDEYFHIPEISA